jgi:RNA polymerase sigma factor (sigma-70 family)
LTERGFDSFYEERFGKAIVMLTVLGASRADAEDAVQEAMLSAWRQWDKIQNPDSWVRTVATRAYYRQVRARQQTVPLDESSARAADSDLSIFTEEQQDVLRVLRALPSEQRTVVAQRYDGATCKEIAVMTGKPAATIRSLLRNARQTLMKKLIVPGGL